MASNETGTLAALTGHASNNYKIRNYLIPPDGPRRYLAHFPFRASQYADHCGEDAIPSRLGGMVGRRPDATGNIGQPLQRPSEVDHFLRPQRFTH